MQKGCWETASALGHQLRYVDQFWSLSPNISDNKVMVRVSHCSRTLIFYKYRVETWFQEGPPVAHVCSRVILRYRGRLDVALVLGAAVHEVPGK